MLSRTLRAPWWWQAVTAIGSAIVAFALTLLLHLRDRPFLLPIIAVLVAALRSGFAAGLLCSIVTLLLANYYITMPQRFGIPALRDAYELAVFLITAAIISLLASRHRQAQLTLEATVASIGDGVIVTGRDARITFLNNVAERLSGWAFKEAIGQPISRVYVTLKEESQDRAADPVARALREGVVVEVTNHTVLVSRDGSEHAISDSAAPIRDLDGRTLGAVLVFRDASAQRKAERALEQQSRERLELLKRERNARAEAEQANRVKDEFLATLSHELRTPLNAVLGWSHMLTRRQLSADQQKQALAAIHRNAQAQARLVDDVLDLSRIVTGRMALASEAVDLSDIVRTTSESFTPAILNKRQDLRLDLEPDASVTGDPHRLRQITWNLLSNATKFTPDGGVIAVRVSRAASHVELSVTDTGLGIDPSFMPFVFDRFRQADSSSTRGHGGLGLGLSLVRYLAEAHGGTVAAMSDGLGRGATIRVMLPARARPTGSGDGTADKTVAV